MSQALLAAPHERLLSMLERLTVIAHRLEAASPGWARLRAHLDQELSTLRAPEKNREAASLPRACARLTQLARTHDGLPLASLQAADAAEFVAQQRLVVLAAWQLQQALEHAGASQ